MKKKRDEFSEATKNILKDRVAGRCSKPDCRIPTTGPKSDEANKVSKTGKAAHITAAASGGPRYDSSLTSEQRKSVENGIWLCSDHATEIDNDPQKYPVEVLNEWKRIAEKKADEEKGTKLPEAHDAINTLVAAATGQPGMFLPRLMSNASKAASGYLEGLDQRFVVETNFHKGITHHTYHPKEPVDVKFKVKSDFSKEFVSKYKALIERGEDLVIDNSAVEVSGSPLLEKITEDVNGTFELHSLQHKEAIIQIWLVSPDKKSKYSFYDLPGDAVHGKRSMEITSSACNKILSIKTRFSVDVLFRPTVDSFSFTLDFKKWNNRRLNALPFFDKLHKLYHKLHQGWSFNFSLEIEGMHLFDACVANISSNEVVLNYFQRLDFIYAARGIADILGYTLYYDSSFKYNTVLYSRVKEIYQVLTKGSFDASVRDINLKPVRQKITAFDDLSNIERLREVELVAVRIDQEEHDKIELFGQKMTLPLFRYSLTKAIPKLLIDNPETIVGGENVDVQFIPVDDCQYTIKKLSDVRSS